MTQNISKTRLIAICGVLTALATLAHALEALIPIPLPIPGIKLGLANIITIFALYAISFRAAFAIMVLRILLGGLISGSLFGFGFILAISGGIVSLIIMAIFKNIFSSLSVVGISALGAVCHNMTQIAVASILLGQSALWFYAPPLFALAIAFGIITGILAKFMIERTNIMQKVYE